MICSELIENDKDVWICYSCYHILHFRCAKKWAKSSLSDTGWNCVACKTFYRHIPTEVVCFCGEISDPKLRPGQLPHSCGKLCKRFLKCGYHLCKSLCHPGPCDSCRENILILCYCGKEFITTACVDRNTKKSCENICGKLRDCKRHFCNSFCHLGPCEPCEKTVVVSCNCGKESKSTACCNINTKYSCGKICRCLLDCRICRCRSLCHSSPCNPCQKKFCNFIRKIF